LHQSQEKKERKKEINRETEKMYLEKEQKEQPGEDGTSGE
jgi:hypothetical protein